MAKTKLIEKRFNTDDGTVAYWVTENPWKDLPWLIFLPGLTADHRLFSAQIEHFQNKANCFIWDPPAHGLSRPYPLTFTVHEMARILHRILTAENIKQPVLIGQSMGGYVSQAYLDLHPGCSSAFIAIDSAPLMLSYYSNWMLKALRHTRLMYLMIPWRLLLSWGSKGIAETQTAQEQMRSMMEQYGKIEFCNLAAHGFRMLEYAISKNRHYDIDCPALLLCGARDNVGLTKNLNEQWGKTADLPLIWVEAAGHNSNADQPAFVNCEIERFVAEKAFTM